MNCPPKHWLTSVLHLLVWICLFFYPFLFHYLPIRDSWAVLRVASFLGMLAFLFYFNTCILIPMVLGKKRVVIYLLSSFAIVALVGIGMGHIQVQFNPAVVKEKEIFDRGVNTGIIAGLLSWIISSAIKVTTEWFKNQQMMRRIENEKLLSELSFLKSQVNPHFLFNALNNIYSLQHKNSPDTGSAILKLSELIRYMLYETAPDFVSLEKEINYIRNYIELQKLGLSPEVKVNFNVKGDVAGKNVRAMLFIPLVENIFKHGVSYIKNSELDISVEIGENYVELKTSNPIGGKMTNGENKSGIGLNNLRKRLDLLYSGKHEFNVTTDAQIFKTNLKLYLA